MRNERAGPFLPHRMEDPTLIAECEHSQQERARERGGDKKREEENTYQRIRKGK